MAAARACALLLLAAASAAADGASAPPPPPPPPLRAFIVAHSHCDPGWLESFEGYYSSQVDRILSSVVRALAAEPSRRFVWAEMSFWMRWYEVQGAEVKALVRRLVAAGQLEFVGGGWVQNDEANPDFGAVVAQISEGHEYLKTLFGVRARFAWQVDPFGHAAAFAAVAAASGFEALVINRIDHTAKDALKARAAMEFEWRPYFPAAGASAAAAAAAAAAASTTADSVGRSYANASIFTHVLHTHYSAPRGFDFENPEGVAVSAGNVGQRAAMLVAELRGRARAYRTSNLLVPFGDDFKFQDAERQFSNMDQLVRHVNAASERGEGDFAGVRLQYATLSDYFDAVAAEAGCGAAGLGAAGACAAPFPLFTPARAADGGADWFPYADNQHSWWVGYYTSRPQLKGAVRRTTSLLRGADALLALVRPWASLWQKAAAAELASAFAVAATAAAGAGAGAGMRGGDEDEPAADQQERRQVALTAAPYALYSWLRAFQRVEQVRLDAALCLHHDAITGTSRESVVVDYTRRMAEGNEDARALIADLASLVLGGLHRGGGPARGGGGQGGEEPEEASDAAGNSGGAGGAGGSTLGPAPLTYVRHVLPVADAVVVEVSRTARRPSEAGADASPGADAGEGEDGAGANTAEAFFVAPSTPAEPVVVYNPASWRRTQAISVLIDVGSAIAAAEGATACRATRWPYALVSNDEGRIVASQWLASVEEVSAARGVFEAAEAGGAAAPGGGVRTCALDTCGRPLSPIERSASGWAAGGVRYELSFLADVEPLSLATFFVSVGWSGSVVDEDAAGAPPAPAVGGRLFSGCGAENALARRLGAAAPPTLIAVPGEPAAAAPAGCSPGALAGERLLSGPVAVPASAASAVASAAEPTPPLILENACLKVEVDASTGLLLYITRKAPEEDGDSSGGDGAAAGSGGGGGGGGGVRVAVRQGFAAYRTQQSGAYIFRPVDFPAPLEQEAAAPKHSSAQQVAATVSVTATLEEGPAALASSASSAAGPAPTQQVLRVVGPRWGQTLRLTNSLGWRGGAAGARGSADGLARACSDPTIPDGSLELIPTEVFAEGNQEVIMSLDTAIDVARGADDASTNARDSIGKGAAGAAGAGSVAADAGEDSLPTGWWTSDGLGLLRRRPAPLGTTAPDVARHFYPLNTLARLAGPVFRAAADGSAAPAPPHAWLSVYTQQPFGAMVRETALLDTRSRLEVMLHRHLSQDDGRGLATGVQDNTRLSPTLLLTLGASRTSPGGAAAVAGAASARRPRPLHADWQWRWATQAALHMQPMLTLHADRGAGGGSAARAARKGAAARPQSGIVPPADLAAGLGVDAPPAAGGASAAAAAGGGGGDAGDSRRFRSAGGDGEYAVALAEPAQPIAWWASRFSTRFRGLRAARGLLGGPLPPWAQIETLQARDAVSDDVVLRLQNVGGPRSLVDLPRLFSRSRVAVRHLRPRFSLSMSASLDGQPELAARASLASPAAAAAAAKRAYPLSALPLYAAMREDAGPLRLETANALNAIGSEHARNLLGRGEALDGRVIAPAAAAGDDAGAAARQNTDEEGVFISDAALENQARQAAAGRRLFEEKAGERRGHILELPERSFASFLLTFEAAAPAPAAAAVPSKRAALGRPRAGGASRRAAPAPAPAESAPPPLDLEEPAPSAEAPDAAAAAEEELPPPRPAAAALEREAADALEARLAMLQRGVPAARGARGAAAAAALPLPRDPWLVQAESPDFFDELRRPNKKARARPRHDHDVEPIELFADPSAVAPGADAFVSIAVAGVLLWTCSLALLACAVMRCCWCRPRSGGSGSGGGGGGGARLQRSLLPVSAPRASSAQSADLWWKSGAKRI